MIGPMRNGQDREAATLIVLAGGKSRRMGRDKAGLRLGGVALLDRVVRQVEGLFDEVLVSVSPGRAATAPGYRTVEDAAPGQGPLAGILAGLKAARNDACAVLACDIPEIDLGFLEKLLALSRGVDIAVPVSPAGHFEPLLAVYRKAVIPEIEALVAAGELSILPLYERCRTRRVALKDASWLRNLNTREDYEAYVREVGRPPARGKKPSP